MSDYERDETRAALESLFWRARVARDALDAANADPDERAKAACHWALLYRVVHSRRRETAEGRTRRLDFFESLAAKADIAPLSFYLREFAQGISHAILASPDPVKKLDRILRRPSRRGPKERPSNQNIKIAAEVEKLRPVIKLRPDGMFEKRPGMTLENACKKVAETTRPLIGIDAVRRIYENAAKEEGGAALVRLVAAGVVEF